MSRAATIETKPYSYCFAGVKLPEPFQTAFVRTSREASMLFPGIRLMHSRVEGHVTASYLGDLDEVDIHQVGQVLTDHSPRLVGQVFTLERLVVQSRKSGFRAMIEVQAPDAWHRFVEDVNTDLIGLTADHLTSFTKFPHVTIGNKKYESDVLSQAMVRFNQGLLAERARKMEGSFPLSELTVWGKDTDDLLGTQVVRRTIPLGGRNRRLFYGGSPQSQSA